MHCSNIGYTGCERCREGSALAACQPTGSGSVSSGVTGAKLLRSTGSLFSTSMVERSVR